MRLLRAKKPKAHKTARDLQREATRAKLMEAARKLFSEYGYEDVSVTDIGKEAGVSHAMIYANFSDKAGLLYEIVRENNAPQLPAAQKAAQSSGNAIDRIMKVLGVWAKYDLADPELLAVMQAYSWTWSDQMEVDNIEERDMHTNILSALVDEGVANSEFASQLDPDVAAEALFAIYTWGLRPAVFGDVSPAGCIKRLRPQVELLLGLGDTSA